MKTCFADTFYFLALVIPDDAAHAWAEEFTAEYDGRIVTTEWILMEFGDAMASPENRAKFVEFLQYLRGRHDVEIIPAGRTLFEQAVEFFANRPDKEWSLTDCTSFVVMGQRGFENALTGDHHFRQAGFNPLAPA